MKRISIIVAVLAMLSLLLGSFGCASSAPASTSEQNYEWKLHSAWPPNDLTYEFLPELADYVSKQSDGRLEITIYPGDSLLPTTELMDGCRQGAIEMLQATDTYWRDEVPEGNFTYGIPFSMRNHEEMAEYLYDWGALDIVREAFNEAGIYYLDVHFCGEVSIMSNKPVYSAADWVGMKARVPGSIADVMKEWGASPVMFPGSELFMAMQLGTVDACVWDVSAMVSLGYYEVVDYYIMPPIMGAFTGDILIDLKAWESLPSDLQQILTDGAEYYRNMLNVRYDAESEKVITMADALGYEVITVPEADVLEMTAKAESVWDEIGAQSDRCGELLELMKDFRKAKD